MHTGAERGHGQRGSSQDSGVGTEKVGHEEEEGKERDGHRQVGSGWGNDWERRGCGNDWERRKWLRKEGMTEKRRNDWEKKEWLTYFSVSFLFFSRTNSKLFEFNSNLNSTPMHSIK
jgi:hypothetical protein